MKELLETISNPMFKPETEYCRHFLRKKHFAPVSLEQFSVSADMPVSHAEIGDLILVYDIDKAKKNYAVEEKLEGALCPYQVIAGEESKSMASMCLKVLTSNLLSLRSASGYSSTTSTSPIISKLSKIWINFVTGLTWSSIDIDRIHRNLIFDVTSLDPVEDFLRIEPFGEIAEIQLRIPYVSDPMPRFNKIVSSPSAQKNISFDQAPKVVTLDFEEEE